MVEYAQMRYNSLGNASHWFPGRRADQLDTTELQSIIKNSPHRDLIPARLAAADQLLGGQAVKRLSQQ